MKIVQYIKNERAQHKKKKPFRRDIFNKISGLVRWYGLDDGILKRLDKAVDYLPEEKTISGRFRQKIPFEFPLFSLATKKDYNLAMAIIHKIDNPYLQFVQSPEEILLCQPLYRLNPELSHEQLMQYHFKTLFLNERAKAENMKT
jgi:hypothetical protein